MLQQERVIKYSRVLCTKLQNNVDFEIIESNLMMDNGTDKDFIKTSLTNPDGEIISPDKGNIKTPNNAQTLSKNKFVHSVKIHPTPFIGLSDKSDNYELNPVNKDVNNSKKKILHSPDSLKTKCPDCSRNNVILKGLKIIITEKEKEIKNLTSIQKKLKDKLEKYIQERDEAKSNAKAVHERNVRLQKVIIEKYDERKLMYEAAVDTNNVDGINPAVIVDGNYLPIGYVRKSSATVHLGKDIWIPEKQYNGVLRKANTPSTCAGAVIIAVFGEATLIKSTITGKPSNRTHEYDHQAFEIIPCTLVKKYIFTATGRGEKKCNDEVNKNKLDDEIDIFDNDTTDDDESSKRKKNYEAKKKKKKRKKKGAFNLKEECRAFYEYARRKISYLKRTDPSNKTKVVNNESDAYIQPPEGSRKNYHIIGSCDILPLTDNKGIHSDEEKESSSSDSDDSTTLLITDCEEDSIPIEKKETLDDIHNTSEHII